MPADSIFTRHKEYGSFFTFNTKQWTPRDTDITQIQCYQPFLNVSPDAIFLGNNGLAGRRMMPTAESNVGFRLENNVFNPYFFNENSVLYYDTKRPFTSITYVQGAKKEQFLNILHTQNITPLINVGFNYRRTKSDGFFAHQNTSYNNLRLFVSGRNKKNNLNYLINIYTNKLIAFENWGILSDTSFEQIGFGNKALLQVQNTSAQNNRNLSGGFAKS
ncbi:MAG: hypothetical protein IT239_03755, partial [Bacteroidia bacterium]|nr:hypothetical protein [Bacteroidia bacterium]